MVLRVLRLVAGLRLFVGCVGSVGFVCVCVCMCACECVCVCKWRRELKRATEG